MPRPPPARDPEHGENARDDDDEYMVEGGRTNEASHRRRAGGRRHPFERHEGAHLESSILGDSCEELRVLSPPRRIDSPRSRPERKHPPSHAQVQDDRSNHETKAARQSPAEVVDGAELVRCVVVDLGHQVREMTGRDLGHGLHQGPTSSWGHGSRSRTRRIEFVSVFDPRPSFLAEEPSNETNPPRRHPVESNEVGPRIVDRRRGMPDGPLETLHQSRSYPRIEELRIVVARDEHDAMSRLQKSGERIFDGGMSV